MAVDFNVVRPFKYWCQKVLPAVYDDSLSYYELLCKVSAYLNDVIELTNTQSDAITELQELVEGFISGDLDPYIYAKIDEWWETHEPQITAELELLQAQIEEVETRMLIPFNDKPGLFIGDSYSYGTGASDHLHGDTMRFTSIITRLLGLSHEYNYAVGATGFVDPGNTPGESHTFADQIELANSELSTAVKNAMGVVFICGGINDYNENSVTPIAMRNASAHAVSIAKSYFPNAKIVVVPMLYKGWGVSPRVLQFEMEIYQGAINTGAPRVEVITHGWTWFHGLSQAVYDSLHPNDTGHNQIARRICAALAGSGNTYRNANFVLTLESGYDFVTLGNISRANNTTLMVDGMIQFGDTYISVPETVTANTATLIGTVENGAVPFCNICGLLMHSNKLFGIYIITTSGNVYITPNADLSGNVYLQPVTYLPCGSSLL